MLNPFAAEPRSIPVRVCLAPASVGRTTAVLHLSANPAHAHDDGQLCPGCAAQLDVRGRLFSLLQEARQGLRRPFGDVLILVDDSSSKQQAIDALTVGTWPARALRDHTVAKSFHLAPTVP